MCYISFHSLGAVASPVTRIELKDSQGKVVGAVPVPSLEAPTDLQPHWTDITFTVPEGTDLRRGSVQVDPEGKIKLITRKYTSYTW